MKKMLPAWSKEIKKSMVDKDLTVTDLATEVGLSRQYISAIINARIYAPDVAAELGSYLDVITPYKIG